jgi:FlaA1/EpsC-like NDP-sugar epimerase
MENKRIKQLNRVSIEDLLGRAPIQIDTELIRERLKGKTVLITGAAGSIGSEIVRQLCLYETELLLLCDIAESPLHQLCLDMEDNFPDIKFCSLIADVRNYDKMKWIFNEYKPQYIYHAAAYKHVPMMEHDPCEAVLTNVLGTKNTADLAVIFQSECFVMISTDKAVNPANIMGASKRLAEIYIQSLSSQTRFIVTRFGNVLGSNGSVIPRFTEQIKRGGPVTITHPDIIRFFMTIPEACRLVLEAGNMGKGGEVFLFDMGKPIRIKDMAEKMIRLSGLEPYKDIEIKVTGLRPGEKLHEELLYDTETVKGTSNEKIKIGTISHYDYEQILSDLIDLFEIAKHYDKSGVVKKMKEIIPEFISNNSIYSNLDK